MARDSQFGEGIGRGRQALAGAAAVLIHLANERVETIELQFFAKEGDEGDVQAAAIEVALEIEQEDFQQRRAVVESRAAAKTRHPVEALITLTDAHRIDTVLETAILVEPDVGGRIAEVAAAFLAMDDFPGNEPGPTQHSGGLVDLSFRERHTDRAGRDRPFGDVDM